jgi:L-threonylcarbamoyladenylate synthase
MNEEEIVKAIKCGKIFIYPTDTIYGIGCDATRGSAVDKIKDIKGRDEDKPLSVIAPSIDWIKENLIVDDGLDLDKYFPGPYTVILKKKDVGFLRDVAVGDSLGVRIPDSEFCDLIRKTEVPFVTTSVNLSGEDFASEIEGISPDILERVDVVIDEGKLTGKPSTLVIDGKEVKRN